MHLSDALKWCLNYKFGTALALVLARVISYAPRVMLQNVASLTDDSWGIIYNHNMFVLAIDFCYTTAFVLL